jgi:ubiquinone/menaquinone biosynthesis C-methylase UbiE
MKLLVPLLRWFSRHLYTDLAWTYDVVAWVASVGQWGHWQAAGLERLPPGTILEIGHGPGHLLLLLASQGRCVIGLDLSRQMGRIASRRLRMADMPPALTRARTQAMPFPPASFDGLLSTFPSEYLLDPQTVREAFRVLRPGGRLVVIPAATITGGSLPDRLGAWLGRVTGQLAEPQNEWMKPFEEAGFHTSLERVQHRRGLVGRLLADKPGASVRSSHG